MKPEAQNPRLSSPGKLLIAALSVTGVVLVVLVIFIFHSYRSDVERQRHDLKLAELRGTILHLDEVLTMSARMASVTGGAEWERRYREFEPALDAAIKEALALAPEAELIIADTDTANTRLVTMENRAFELVRNGRAEEARAVLFSPDYEEQKRIYVGGMTALVLELNDTIARSQQRKQQAAFWSVFAAVVCLALLVVSWRVFLARLRRLHAELLAASRRSGMAEVATGVLHNVGNVLNSVNVSAGLIAHQVEHSKSASLARAVALMREHRGEETRFLTLDPKGRQMPAFVEAVSVELTREQGVLAREAASLLKNIEHIKQVVAMQQDYARAAHLREAVAPAEVVETALELAAATIAGRRIQIAREFAPVPAVLADRHAVLQILVNLITNAAQALETRAGDRRLTLRITRGDGAASRIEITDNGVGIAPENLAKIFAHGFTTKKNGHGFGLHSGANAAKEMGGSLTARSDGPGAGATFMLELPHAAAVAPASAPASFSRTLSHAT